MADDIAELEEAIIGLRAKLRSLEDMVFNHISLDASSDYPHPSQRVNALQFAPGLRLDSSLAYPPNGYVLTADNTKKSGLTWAPAGGTGGSNGSGGNARSFWDVVLESNYFMSPASSSSTRSFWDVVLENVQANNYQVV